LIVQPQDPDHFLQKRDPAVLYRFRHDDPADTRKKRPRMQIARPLLRNVSSMAEIAPVRRARETAWRFAERCFLGHKAAQPLPLPSRLLARCRHDDSET
jgi:hypothetical protein